MRRLQYVAVAAVASGLMLAAWGTATASTATPPAVRELSGTFHLVPGACHQGRPSGSYLAVTFGTRAIKNTSSRCDSGAVTLLRPGAGVITGQYSTAAQGTFDGRHLGLLTSHSSQFAAPRIYLVGNQIVSDLRSAEAAYDGGQWSVGAERATGHYLAATHQLSLQWFSGQSFTPSSAGTEVHLAGTFTGTIRRVPQGTTVDLGTASFAAGASTPVVENAAQTTSHRRNAARHSHGRHARRARLAARATSTTTGSPKAFLLAEALVLANLVAFAGLSRRRGRK